MSIFRKRPTGDWEAQIRRRGLHNFTRTLLLISDEVALASEHELAVYRGEVINRSLAVKMTLGELFLRYMEQIPAVAARAARSLRGHPEGLTT